MKHKLHSARVRVSDCYFADLYFPVDQVAHTADFADSFFIIHRLQLRRGTRTLLARHQVGTSLLPKTTIVSLHQPTVSANICYNSVYMCCVREMIPSGAKTKLQRKRCLIEYAVTVAMRSVATDRSKAVASSPSAVTDAKLDPKGNEIHKQAAFRLFVVAFAPP